MKIGDLLIRKNSDKSMPSAISIVVDLKEDTLDSSKDKIFLRWTPKNKNSIIGEHPRHIIEKHYEVLSDG